MIVIPQSVMGSQEDISVPLRRILMSLYNERCLALFLLELKRLRQSLSRERSTLADTSKEMDFKIFFHMDSTKDTSCGQANSYDSNKLRQEESFLLVVFLAGARQHNSYVHIFHKIKSSSHGIRDALLIPPNIPCWIIHDGYFKRAAISVPCVQRHFSFVSLMNLKGLLLVHSYQRKFFLPLTHSR